MKEISVGGKIVPVKDFDMNKLRYAKDGKFLNPRICIIAKSGSGKSWVVRDILSILNDIPAGIVIAPTDKLTKFYDSVFPSSFIHHEFRPEILSNLLDRQDRIFKKNAERAKKGKEPIDPRVFLVMDDLQSKKDEWVNDLSFISIMCEGRHRAITLILVLQYSLAIPPSIRSNFNYVCLLADSNFNGRRKLFEHYAGIFPKYEIFDNLFTQLTDNYGTMILDNASNSRDLNERVFWYKSKEQPPFPICSSRFIEFHEQNYQKEDEKKRNIFNINDICQPKKANFIVSKVKAH
jgi:hypothetical protein